MLGDIVGALEGKVDGSPVDIVGETDGSVEGELVGAPVGRTVLGALVG